MSTAALDVVGCLPAPSNKANRGAADLLEGQLFAYGIGSAVAVVEVPHLQLACVLHGAPRNSAISALKWNPDCHSRDLRDRGHLTLAAGDADGGVLVWDVPSASVLASLADVASAKELVAERQHTGKPTVQGLAWVLPRPGVLAVVLAPALLVLWDTTAGSLLWQRDMSAAETVTSMAADPLDRRRLVLCGSAGLLLVMQLTNPEADRVEQANYRVNLAAPSGDKAPTSGGMQALLCSTRDMLLVMLPRELLVFDLELGVPAASSPLKGGRSPFATLLGAFGSGVTAGGGEAGGLDFVFLSHTDGSLSVWVRTPGELRFSLKSMLRLVPPNVKGGHLPPPQLLAVRATLVQRPPAPPDSSGKVAARYQSAAGTASITRQLSASLKQGVSANDANESALTPGGRPAHSGPAPTAAASRASLLAVGVTSDGRVWHWDAPLPEYPDRLRLAGGLAARPLADVSNALQAAAKGAVAPEPIAPHLVGLLHGLPAPITCIHVHPRLLVVPPSSKGAAAAGGSAPAASAGGIPISPFARASTEGGTAGGAALAGAARAGSSLSCLVLAGTATGQVDVLVVRRGIINPLAPEVVASLGVHRDPVGGARWLGSTCKFVSYSSAKAGASGVRNTLAISDLRSRRSVPLRAGVASDPGPVRGVRVSPSGAHLLILFAGAPPELWAIPSCLPAPAFGANSSAGGGPASSRPSDDGVAAPAEEPDPRAVPPFRLRLVDLPFTAVEWVTPDGRLRPHGDPRASAPPPLQLLRRDESGGASVATANDPSIGGGSDGAGTPVSPPAATPGATQPSTTPAAAGAQARVVAALPEELLAFSLSDSRSGILRVRGNKLTDIRPKRPFDAARGSMVDMVATAVAGYGTLLCLGDADGDLMWWDAIHGQAQLMSTGMGRVRRIALGPPPCPLLFPTLFNASGVSSAEVQLRVVVSFDGGAFAVYEVDAAGRFRQGHVGLAAAARAGRLSEVCWLPLPPPVGGGTVVVGVADSGALVLMDAAQATEAGRGLRRRQRRLRQLLAMPSEQGDIRTSGSGVQLWQLTPPRAVGSSLLVWRPWVQLLRVLLQLGLSKEGLLVMGSPTMDEDDEVRDELHALLPTSVRALMRKRHVLTGTGSTEDPSSQSSSRLSGVDASAGAGPRAPADPDASLPTTTASTTTASTTTTDAPAPGGPAPSPAPSLPDALEEALRAGALPSALVPPGLSFVGAPPELTGRSFDGDLVALLRRLAALRAHGQLLPPQEWIAYTQALQSGLVSERMAVAARVSCDDEEASFWEHLPSTLAAVNATYTFILQQQRRRRQGAPPPLQPQPPAPTPAPAAAAEAAGSGAAENGDGVDAAAHEARVEPPSTGAAGGAASDGGAGQGEAHSDAGNALVAALDADAAGYHRLFESAGDESPPRGPGSAGDAADADAGPESGGSGGDGGAAAAPLAGAPPLRQASGVDVVGAVAGSSGGGPVRLWDERLVIGEALERALWHEAMARSLFDNEALQERRLLEYVVLGDFQSAVAFLLASPPERSARYYRDAVVTLALAATASLSAQGAGGASAAAATLHLQAAKVVSAHAASVGDALLGVPLNCSAGLHSDAASILMDVGLFRYAAVLTASALRGTERAQALSRWAAHVLGAEGSVWRAAGVLTAAGCLRAAAAVLREAGLPDCARAYVAAAAQAGLLIPSAEGAPPPPSSDPQQQQQQQQGELFDLLGARLRGGRGASGSGAPLAAHEEVPRIAVEWEQHLCLLVAHL